MRIAVQRIMRRYIAMRTWTRRKHVAVVSMTVLLAGLSIWPTQPAQAADPLVKGAIDLAPGGELSVLASGAAEDTLKACMARIPGVASAGQRMLAEQTCAGEEETRKVIRSAPTF
jgi:hypothetical protein